MPSKILLADDSMTAQNMGKKILAEGGYEVVAVSNGAAALKKITEFRPELVILDVYMPGYTGLEVCERLRGALNTATLPVVLTVGKLEPFKPEEGNRVKADALLVKPFEATDLLVTVKKLLEKTAPEPAPTQDTVKQEPAAADASYEAWKTETPADYPSDYQDTQKIEVPQDLAAIPALGDVLEAPAQPPAIKPPKADAAAASAAMPAFSVEAAVPDFTVASAPVFDLDLPLDEPTLAMPAAEPPIAPASESILDAVMPELQEPELEQIVPSPPPEAVAPVPEVEFTSAPQAQNLTVEALPELEPTVLQEAIPVEVASDAALVTSPEELAEFTTTFGVEEPENIPVGIVSDLPPEQAAALTEPESQPVSEAPAIAPSPAPPVEAAPIAAPELAALIDEVLAAEPQPKPQPAALEPEAVLESEPATAIFPTGEPDALLQETLLGAASGAKFAPVAEELAPAEFVPEPAVLEPEAVAPSTTAAAEPLAAEPDTTSRPAVPEFEPMPPPAPVAEKVAISVFAAPAEPAVEEPAAAPPDHVASSEMVAALTTEALASPQPAPTDDAFSLEAELQRAFADVPAAPPAPEVDSVVEVPNLPADEAASSADDDAIAKMVARVMDRLKPDLVAAIVRELKGK